MINPIYWKDHVVEYPNRYTVEDDGTYETLTKAPGTVQVQGTPMNAANFNNMDQKALQGIMSGLVMAQFAHQLHQKVSGIEGTVIEVTLTNSKSYPFNDSIQSVALTGSLLRNTTDYSVLAEVVSSTGGGVGEIRITNKLVNGFKVEFTGAASSVTVRLFVQGGI